MREIAIQSEIGTDLNDNIQSWIAANGISPEDVPMSSVAAVDPTANEITFTVFQRDPEGVKVISYRNGQPEYLKCLRTVPLLSAPEDHNL